jgi:hypothetical protein
LAAWEKGIIAGKSNEVVLSQTSGPISGGTTISVYTLDPIFEEETRVSFMDAEGNLLPAETNFVSGNELEVTTPQAAEGAASVVVDNPTNVDIQGTDLFTFFASAPSSPITSQASSLPACTCRIKPTGTFTITAGTSGYRRFKAFTENCAGSMLQCGKRFQLTYYVDGVTNITSCNELAIREQYAEWVFPVLPVNSTHTIGVQLVEWWPESVWNEDGKGKHVEKACAPYGPIVNVPVKIPGASNNDSDADGISDGAEDIYMNTYNPRVYQNCAD